MPLIERFDYQDLKAIRVGRINRGVTTTFVVYRLGTTMIDTGPANQWRYIQPFVSVMPVEHLFLTHHHEDHAGNAARIQALSGVQPWASALAVEKLRTGYKIPPAQRFVWGSAEPVQAREVPDSLEIDGGEVITAIAAPGHAKDMLCYFLPRRGWLFTADLYIANYLRWSRSDEHMPILVNSIRRVLQLDFATILCPHRGLVSQGRQRLQEKLDYLLELSGKAQQLDAQGLPLDQITRRLLGREGLLTYLTGYNLSKRNLIRSCLEVSLQGEL